MEAILIYKKQQGLKNCGEPGLWSFQVFGAETRGMFEEKMDDNKGCLEEKEK